MPQIKKSFRSTYFAIFLLLEAPGSEVMRKNRVFNSQKLPYLLLFKQIGSKYLKCKAPKFIQYFHITRPIYYCSDLKLQRDIHSAKPYGEHRQQGSAG